MPNILSLYMYGSMLCRVLQSHIAHDTCIHVCPQPPSPSTPQERAREQRVFVHCFENQTTLSYDFAKVSAYIKALSVCSCARCWHCVHGLH